MLEIQLLNLSNNMIGAALFLIFRMDFSSDWRKNAQFFSEVYTLGQISISTHILASMFINTLFKWVVALASGTRVVSLASFIENS